MFPVVGPVQYTNDFGAPRGRNSHQGNDLMAPRKALAVAAEGGKVKFHTTSWAAGCMLYLYGDSGTTYMYIHLNNDLGATNDNKGACKPGIAFAPGLKSGARVEAGDVVGYVGDSGDADGISPHLHFEVHPRGGAAVSPYPYLRKARKLLFSVRTGAVATLSLTGTLIAADETSLKLKVSALRIWPGGPRIEKVDRVVELEVLPTTRVERTDGVDLALDRLVTKIPKTPVVVWTEPAGATLAQRLGAAGALTTARVVVRP